MEPHGFQVWMPRVSVYVQQSSWNLDWGCYAGLRGGNFCILFLQSTCNSNHSIPSSFAKLAFHFVVKVDLYPGDDSLHDFVIGTVAEAWIQSGVWRASSCCSCKTSVGLTLLETMLHMEENTKKPRHPSLSQGTTTFLTPLEIAMSSHVGYVSYCSFWR